MTENLIASSGHVAGDSGSSDLVMTVHRVVAQLSEEQDTNTLLADLPGHLHVAIGAEPATLLVGNLLDNALPFSTPGAPVSVSARDEGADVVLVVTNTAPALDAIDLQGLFDAFARGDTSDTRATAASDWG